MYLNEKCYRLALYSRLQLVTVCANLNTVHAKPIRPNGVYNCPLQTGLRQTVFYWPSSPGGLAMPPAPSHGKLAHAARLSGSHVTGLRQQYIFAQSTVTV